VAMAGRVSELLVDETERRRVGARGRARAVAFQTDRLVPRLEGIYRELVSPSRR
jgi:hypothetical protein